MAAARVCVWHIASAVRLSVVWSACAPRELTSAWWGAVNLWSSSRSISMCAGVFRRANELGLVLSTFRRLDVVLSWFMAELFILFLRLARGCRDVFVG